MLENLILNDYNATGYSASASVSLSKLTITIHYMIVVMRATIENTNLYFLMTSC